MDRIALREYRPGDTAAMYALDLLCFDPVFQFSRRVMQRFAEAPGAVTLLAELQNQLAGFCIVQREERVGYVVTLDVVPVWRRRGLARHLMSEVESRMHSAGAECMELHVFTGNVGAIQFYEGIEYRPSGRAENFYGKGLDALVYRKKL
jgi:ribosomal-protein-alanine N-acetyltransferase